MIRRFAIAFVAGLAFLILLAEVQRLDDMANDQIEQLHLERVARSAQ
jgi:hypothetical protein